MKKFLKGIWLFLRHGPCKVVEWREQASCDALTGLCSRAFFAALADFEIAETKRSDASVGLLLIDINDFKGVNDREGHAAGDRVLREAAKIIKEVCRREIDVLCRWGGDEFVVLLPQTTFAGARKLAGQLNAVAITSPKGKEVTFSCGATAQSGGNVSLDQLIEAADQDMYAQKRSKQKA